MAMRIGLSAYNMSARDLVALARDADDLGFESLWLGEHVMLPLDYGSEHPTTGAGTGADRQHRQHRQHTGPIIDPSTKLLDPLVALSAAAVATTRIRLATGIYLLPLRHPLISARMVATLHDVSGGRFSLGVGSGWLAEEFDAVGVAFARRRARFEESIDVLRASWRGEPFEHHGTEFDFGPVQVCPEPIRVPLILGGNTEPALRRAARVADGWFSSGTPSFDDAMRLRDRLDALRTDLGRTDAFEVTVRAHVESAEELVRYEAAGLDHVTVWADRAWTVASPADERRAQLAAAAARLGVTPR